MASDEQLSKEKNDFYWLTLQNRVNELKISEAFRFMRSRGFEPILIKGWSIARYYPQIWRRRFIDIDLCVAPKDFEKAKKLLETPEGLKHNIDLHKGLKPLDTVAWDDLFENSETVKIDNTLIRTLRAEDHLRIVCVHWLADGGAYKDRLWDIYYLVENRPRGFDWTRCLDIVSPKRRRWIICCLGLTHKYLGLDLTDTPVAAEAKNIPGWLIKTVEREWRTEVKLKPLQNCLHDRRLFWRQIKKRIPPNPLQATIELDGEFDDNSRVFYQLANILTRFFPAVSRISRRLSQNFKADYEKK
ncbi:MAG: nucleotidyltransferase family protein [Acidobacteriota bacterium]|nr:nucleotidyltransferase family protein [Acidobacteriota bacterium]